MQIELLYFEPCPHWRHSLKELNDVLHEHGVADEIELIEVKSVEEAQRLEFLGSPTIRVEGLDVEPDIPESGYDIACRTYWIEDEAVEKPPKEWLAAAIDAALG